MRRTKAESEKTRQHILVTARREFAAHGLTRTTMQRIARAAGVSRGAVYWHFANKRELFRVMRDQVSLPLFDRVDVGENERDPLAAVERFLHGLVDRIESDAQTRSTLDILSLRCEYVDEFRPELAKHMKRCAELQRKLVALYERARDSGALRNDVAPDAAALGTTVLIVGMLRLWLIDRGRTFARGAVDALIASHVAVLRASARGKAASAVEPDGASLLK